MSVQLKRINYFPIDICFFEDEKIELMIAEFGMESVAILLKLQCAIYSNSYYLPWNENRCKIFASKFRMRNAARLQRIVNWLVDIGYFEQSLYENEGILTSRDIQTQFFGAIARRKKLKTEDLDYLIIDLNNEKQETRTKQKNANKSTIQDNKKMIQDDKTAPKEEYNKEEYNKTKEEKTSSSSEEVKEVVEDVNAFGGKNLYEKKNLKSYRLELLGNDSWCRSIAQLSDQEELSYRELPQVMELFELHIATQNCENEIFSGNEYARRFTNWWRCLGFRSAENIRKVNLSRGDHLLSRCETRANRPSKVEQAMEVSKQVSENVKKLLGYV